MSADSKPTPSLSYYAIIPHSERRAVLVHPHEEGWTLPHVTTEDWTKLSVNALSAHIREMVGIDATALRRVLIYRNGDDLLRTFILMENHTPTVDLNDAQWISADEIDVLTDPLHQKAVQRWLSEPLSDPPLRTPWAKEGWFAQTRAWIEDQVQKAGFTLTEPLYIRRSWSLTCMMVQPTDQGNLYIKATNAMFTPEGTLTSQLAEWFPANMPQVVVSDPARGMYIMRDFEAAPLHEVKDHSLWEQAAAIHARHQRESIEHVDRLLALGCWDRRPLALMGYVDELVCDPEPLHIGQANGLTEDEFRQYQETAPRLKALCEEVEALNIPYTLTHGDFHMGNIAIKDGVPIFFDWSDTSIAHPFMDLFSLIEQYEAKEADLRERVRRAYLNEWRELGSEEMIDHAFDLATRLSILNQAISYRYIFHNIEPSLKEEIDGACVPLAKQIIERFGA